jgi:hypothetical protein
MSKMEVKNADFCAETVCGSLASEARRFLQSAFRDASGFP